MGNLTDEDIETLIYKMRDYSLQPSPYEHLYEWLKEKDPMLFKQWESIYDIMRGY